MLLQLLPLLGDVVSATQRIFVNHHTVLVPYIAYDKEINLKWMATVGLEFFIVLTL